MEASCFKQQNVGTRMCPICGARVNIVYIFKIIKLYNILFMCPINMLKLF
jgi:uncharacterized protein (UPF0212 family)